MTNQNQESEENTKIPVLGLCVILAIAIFICLFTFYLIFLLQGEEGLQVLPEWITDGSAAIWAFLVGAALSVFLEFLESRTISAIKFYGLSVGLGFIFVFSAIFFNWMVSMTTEGETIATEPATVSLAIRMRTNDGPFTGNIEYASVRPLRETIGLSPLSSSEFKNYIEFENDVHRAQISVTAAGSAFFSDTSIDETTTRICIKERKRQPFVQLNCVIHGECEVLHPQADYLICSNNDQTHNSGFSLIPRAYADTDEQQSLHPQLYGKTKGWISPSLSTLRERQKQGSSFTLFTLTSNPIPTLAKAKWVAVAPRANGSAIYIRGLPPISSPQPFDANKGLDISFGLENLAFRGRYAGHEKLEVDLYFLSGKGDVLDSVTLKRDYIALRKANPVILNFHDIPITWKGEMQSAMNEFEYTVNLLSSTNAEALVNESDYLSQQQVNYPLAEGTHLVSVVRPPLPPNQYYGVVAGLQDSTNKIKFTFSEQQAKELCHWIKNNAERYHEEFRYIKTDSIYLYKLTARKIIACD